jgi:hypothetical protein
MTGPDPETVVAPGSVSAVVMAPGGGDTVPLFLRMVGGYLLSLFYLTPNEPM